MLDSETAVRRVVVVSSLLLVLSASFVGAGAVAVQEGPGQPHNFYGGVVDERGTPAPAGVEIFASVDGEAEDSIVVTEAGQYGAEGAFEDKLTVNTGAGEEVVFTVGTPDGPESLGGPYSLSSFDGGVTELDLTFPEDTFGGEPEDFRVEIDESESALSANTSETLAVEATVQNVGGEGAQNVTANVGGDQVGAESSLTLANGSSETVRFEFEAEAGYDGKRVEVASENSTDTAMVTVTDSSDTTPTETPTNGSTPPQTATEAPGSGGGGGGGGGGSDSGSAKAIATDSGVTVNFRELGTGEEVSAMLPGLAADDGTSAVTSLAVESTFSNEGSRVELTPPEQEVPESAPALDGDGRAAASYFTAESFGIENSRISKVTFGFSLSESELPDVVSADDVTLFRYHGGEWVSLQTATLGDGEFSAQSPGFSAFAIGYQTGSATPTPPSETTTGSGTELPATTTGSGTEPPATTTDSPGFGTLVAIVALLAVVAAVARNE